MYSNQAFYNEVLNTYYIILYEKKKNLKKNFENISVCNK